mmetsp:Transcript_93396/g.166129  ORF Transcript_93396/g.166129 Transcript_93396/m.166129 type:complete len:2142 (+) Transcript_93396:117-6542(+)
MPRACSSFHILRHLCFQFSIFVSASAAELDLEAHGTHATRFVLDLQDLLAGAVKDPSAAGRDAVTKFVRRHDAPESKTQVLVKSVKAALETEMQQALFEENFDLGMAELDGLHTDFKACSASTGTSGSMAVLEKSHTACRRQQAEAFKAFKKKCKDDLKQEHQDFGSSVCTKLGNDFFRQKSECDATQDQLDEAACSQTNPSCDERLACEAKLIEAISTARETLEAQEREHLGLSTSLSVATCLLASMSQGGHAEDSLKACQKAGPEHVGFKTRKLAAAPTFSDCNRLKSGRIHYRHLPREAPAKKCMSSCCQSVLLEMDGNVATDSTEEVDSGIDEDPDLTVEGYKQAEDEKNPFTFEGITAWFESEQAAVPWPSRVGTLEASVLQRKADTTFQAGFGSDGAIHFVRGDEYTLMDFGQILDERYTICSITRYWGSPHGRILQGSETDWLHGHSLGKAGVACSSMPQPGGVAQKDNWVAVCATSDDIREVWVNGQAIENTQCRVNVKSKQNLVINHGKAWKETSKWAVAEVVTWNRVLPLQELQTAAEYLNKKIGAGLQLDLKIMNGDQSCNGKRVQVQMVPTKTSGWTHNADGGDGTDLGRYELADSTPGDFKIRTDGLPTISQTGSGKFSAWGHSSLKGKAFVVQGNAKGPTVLSFFGADADCTARVSFNGAHIRDVVLFYGQTVSFSQNFRNGRIYVQATHNVMMAMSSADMTYNTPVAPAAKTIYGILSHDWKVTSLDGNPSDVEMQCSDGTYEVKKVGVIQDNSKSSSDASLIEGDQLASPRGWYLTSAADKQMSCTQVCQAKRLKCSSFDPTLISSEAKMSAVLKSMGSKACKQYLPAVITDAKAPFIVTQTGTYGTEGDCTYPVPGQNASGCNTEVSSGASKLCFCESIEGVKPIVLADQGSNICPQSYLAVENKDDCESIASDDKLIPPSIWDADDPNDQGSPAGCFKNLDKGTVSFNSIHFVGYQKLDKWQKQDRRKICRHETIATPSEKVCKFTALEAKAYLGGVSYDRDGDTAVTFLGEHVFQSETILPMDLEAVKLVAQKEGVTCKHKGRVYRLYGQSPYYTKIEKRLRAADTIVCSHDVMVIGYKNSGTPSNAQDTDTFPRFNLLSATACTAWIDRGVQGLVIDNRLVLEPGYVLTRVLEKASNGEVYTVAAKEFNQYLEPSYKYPFVKRYCTSCAASHTETFYRRFTPVSSYPAYQMLSCNFQNETRNIEGVDFKIYSTLKDTLADENNWKHCKFPAAGSYRGFPGECGPTGTVGQQWNSIAVDTDKTTGTCFEDKGGRAVTYYYILRAVPQTWRLMLKSDKGQVESMGEQEANREFAQSRYHIIMRKCPECSRSHRFIFYRRWTYTDTFEPFLYMACNWNAANNNVFLVDYKLYSTIEDALVDRNSWQNCGYDGMGFPGSCSPTGEEKTGETSFIKVPGCDPNGPDTGKSVSFWIYTDDPAASEEEETPVDSPKQSLDATLPPATVPSGLAFWFRSENASTQWVDEVSRKTVARAAGGKISKGERYYGGVVRHLYGDSGSSFKFGSVVPATVFTICSISAYTGLQMGKVLQGGETWVQGHLDQNPGQISYGTTVVDGKNLTGVRKWITACSSNQNEKAWIDGWEIPAQVAGNGGGIQLGINTGEVTSRSDWAVAELMTWNRVLSRSEFIDAQNYLRAKVMRCQPEQSAQCDSSPCINLFVGPNRNNVMFRNEDGSATVKSDSGNLFSCTCRGYCVGLVGKWDCPGADYGGQYTISSSYHDDWTPETTKDAILLCKVARPCWSSKQQATNPARLVGPVADLFSDSSFSLVAAVLRNGDVEDKMTIWSTQGNTSDSDPKAKFEAVVTKDNFFSFTFSGQTCTAKQLSKLNEWQHVAFVFDAERGETKVYLNALEVKNCTTSAAYSPNRARELLLGHNQGNNRWKGMMNNAEVYCEALHPAMVYRLGEDLSMRKPVAWFSHADNWPRTTWLYAVQFCNRKQFRLASHKDICQVGADGVKKVHPRGAFGDQWIPVTGLHDNAWLQIGDGKATANPVETCKTYKDAYGKPPSWGMDEISYRFKSYVGCRGSQEFHRHETNFGQGACDGVKMPLYDIYSNPTELACKISCLKEPDCHALVWTASVGLCTLMKTCDNFRISSNHTTWLKKPLR